MKVGDIIICRSTRGYRFTTDKEYKVLEYEPPYREENGFTWPAYVQLHDDEGNRVHCHANRFILKETIQ